MSKKSNGKNGALRLYKSYMFRDKEPVIDEFRTIVRDHFGESVTRKHLSMIHDLGGPSTGAMAGWLFGATKRPSNAAMEAAGRAIGKKRVWVDMKPK